jgi:hypothetical protein
MVGEALGETKAIGLALDSGRELMLRQVRQVRVNRPTQSGQKFLQVREDRLRLFLVGARSDFSP